MKRKLTLDFDRSPTNPQAFTLRFSEQVIDRFMEVLRVGLEQVHPGDEIAVEAVIHEPNQHHRPLMDGWAIEIERVRREAVVEA